MPPRSRPRSCAARAGYRACPGVAGAGRGHGRPRRRLESGRKDELRIESRPEGGEVLGLYATRRRGSEARPYRTIVAGVDPLKGRCDCPDYLRNSLGLCKHILVVPSTRTAAGAAQPGDQGAATTGGDDLHRTALGPGSSLARHGRLARAGGLDWRQREGGAGYPGIAGATWFRPDRNGAGRSRRPIAMIRCVASSLSNPCSRSFPPARTAAHDRPPRPARPRARKAQAISRDDSLAVRAESRDEGTEVPAVPLPARRRQTVPRDGSTLAGRRYGRR